MAQTAPDLSVIIVSYNTRNLLRECLQTLLEPKQGISLEVIVVDNASADGSAEMVRTEFPQVCLIANSENRGFGAGCNQGLMRAAGRYALLLNADIRATEGALERLVAFMDAYPEFTACGGQLRYPDGRIQPSCASELTLWAVFCEQTLLEKLFLRTRLFGGYWRTWWDFSSTIETEQVMGACLMLRRVNSPSYASELDCHSERNLDCHSERSEESQTLRFAQGDEQSNKERVQGGEVEIPRLRLGMTEEASAEEPGARNTPLPTPHSPFPLFDEDYFLYCEDTDLCYRIRQAGGKIAYVHDAVFIHHLGASGAPRRAEMVILYNRGKERYFRKFYGAGHARICYLLNQFGALLRVIIGLALTLATLGRVPRFHHYLKTFWQVLWRKNTV